MAGGGVRAVAVVCPGGGVRAAVRAATAARAARAAKAEETVETAAQAADVAGPRRKTH